MVAKYPNTFVYIKLSNITMIDQLCTIVVTFSQASRIINITLPSSFTFQNLHSCTININTAPSQAAPTTTVTDHMEVDIDKIIASITEDYL